MTEADRIVCEPERRSITGISATTAWRLEREGKFPRRVKRTEHRIGWMLSELMAWVESRRRVTLKSVSEERAATH